MDPFIISSWNSLDYKNFRQYLESIGDINTKKFNEKIIFTQYPILGIKTDILRKISKDIAKGNIESYISIFKPIFYEEILIFGFVISYIKDLDFFVKSLSYFLPYIDNWAVCDMCVSSMKIIKNNQEYFFPIIKDYINDDYLYTVRVGVVMLMDFYLTDEYLDRVFSIIDSIKREEYYINMAIAWCISIAFIKHRKRTLLYLKNCQLDKFTYNKAIQKIRESSRVSDTDKQMLQDMKIK